MATYTQAQVDSLRDAYVRGVLTVEHAGKKVTYRSLSEMARLLALMERDLAGTARPKRFALAAIPRRGH